MFRLFIKLLVLTIFFIFFYYYIPLKHIRLKHFKRKELLSVFGQSSTPIYIWCIVVKVENSDSLLLKKFQSFLNSLLQYSKNSVSLNILIDEKSNFLVKTVLKNTDTNTNNHFCEVVFHDITEASHQIKHITNVMQSHFSSTPGTYYSDSLFYMSLGLYEIAPLHHEKAILLDIDVQFRESIQSLYDQFDEFSSEALFGLAPELSPVYFHILWKWKQTHTSTFGEPHTLGFSGVNSGVVLMHLDRIRRSTTYAEYISQSYVDNVTEKYIFKGHLGDQDFYTLLAVEQPALIHSLPCNWNRQLCQWWKHHGYADVFDQFSRCDGPVYIYHGNCNTPVPVN